jgi:DNA-binding Xre family transcriptional regulator
MAEHGIENAHDLAKRSGLPMATAYRLVGNDGRLDRRLSAQLEALCDVFGVEPCELLTRDKAPAPRRKARTKARKG